MGDRDWRRPLPVPTHGTYLGPEEDDGGDEKQEAAEHQENVLGVLDHFGQEYQLPVEGPKGGPLHGPALW